ncbi:conjugal transfer protein TrbF [Caulobacter vibrioides]|nr:conjugal transfer protein TrbF [Caulobacter vibrioides]
MFRRPAVHFGHAPEPETPYRRARQVWDDRLGALAVTGRCLWLLVLVEGGVIVILAGALAWATARGSVTPWVVEVDRLGETRTVAPAEAGYQPTDPQIAFHLARFIENVRGRPADAIVLRRAWLSAYEFTTDKGALALNAYAREQNPFAELGQAQIAVQIGSVIRASPDSFRIAWIERRYQDGALVSTERWTAILTVVVQRPRTAEQLKANPLGLYVNAINWSKEMTP